MKKEMASSRTAAGSRPRVEIFDLALAETSARMDRGSEDDPNLHGLAVTRVVTRSRRKLLRRIQ